MNTVFNIGPKTTMGIAVFRQLTASILGITMLLSTPAGLLAQQTKPSPAPAIALPANNVKAGDATADASAKAIEDAIHSQGITEEEVRKRFNNKLVFLRGLYLSDNLSFNEHGTILGSPKVGSFTLCGLDVKSVRLTKHKLELTGDRVALHFFGALPTEDDTKTYDRVKVTKKKKDVHINIDRELVIKPKKPKKNSKADKAILNATATSPASVAVSAAPDADSEDAEAEPPVLVNGKPAAPDQTTAVVAPVTVSDVSSDPNSVTTTLSPAHSAKMLNDALDKIFADRVDEKMLAGMPDYWKHYFNQRSTKTEFAPSDRNVVRLSSDIVAPRILNSLEPGSNDYAQQNGIAGITLYRTVVGADGKPGEIAIARPIGFGLDEKAVDAIRRSSFQPALKNGQPVAVLVDVVVTFRIFSNRTRGAGVENMHQLNNEPPTIASIAPGPGSSR